MRSFKQCSLCLVSLCLKCLVKIVHAVEADQTINATDVSPCAAVVEFSEETRLCQRVSQSRCRPGGNGCWRIPGGIHLVWGKNVRLSNPLWLIKTNKNCC